ncbi:histidinol-phosphate transaminase [Saxibacter everestensis]|uniref:Histidinol-phosphate aminotransferase n=1 Tax=Saxibacter everestensis TaxID=2909229 RepID=A0ABY8QW26_9MICO|nr:histidinol-phosphate transaminase [Brevibacteriaceae bacterium ZFBP1038]
MTRASLNDLPLRDDLRGRQPYGAPQLDVNVRLNVNENSYAVPESVALAIVEAVAAQVRTLNRYPDREFTALREKLAKYLNAGLDDEHRLTADNIWAANGSNEVLQQIVQAFGGHDRTALGFVPSYSMHPIISQGISTRWMAVDRDADFQVDREDAVRAVTELQPDVVFLCTPNNPSGTALDLATIEAIYDVAPGIVIVDEAYAEFSRSGTRSALTLLPGRERLIVSRTMSKAFSLAGARVGYLAADPAVTDAIRLVRLPYHLSALTQAAAGAALDHSDELLGNVEALKAQRDRIVQTLPRFGVRPFPSDSNFVLFGGLSDAHTVWQRLLDRGILIRDVGIPGHLRVNAGTEAETSAFLDALGEILGETPQ